MLTQAIERQQFLPRFICHIYQRQQQQRLSLVVGAGISIDAKVPGWLALLERLSDSSKGLKSDLAFHNKSGHSPEYLGQIIYHRHKAGVVEADEKLLDAKLNYTWAEAIHKAIYKDVNNDINLLVDQHPYLKSLRDFARKIPLIINFNFDDLLSDAIGAQISGGSGGRPLSVVWDPPLIDRNDRTTIYHVNGILPRANLKKRSPQLIFTEDSFADAIARSPGISGEYIFLRFVQNTMLILGHSLSDASLKNYLRRNKDRNPANHHYMIYWIKAHESLSAGQSEDIFNANLELYNIITIFLTSLEIGELLSVLNYENREMRDFLDGCSPEYRHRFHYYIIGPVAAGKSTILENLRCFATHEEWTRPALQEMYLDFSKLSPDQSANVDKFIYEELKEKNYRMQDASVGFHIMDRAPLDLYAFSRNNEERVTKTKRLREVVFREKPIQNGEILFISASGQTLMKRNLRRGRIPEKSGNDKYLEQQARQLREVYNPTSIFCTDEISGPELAKRIVRKILFGEYTPTDLNAIMNRYERTDGNETHISGKSTIQSGRKGFQFIIIEFVGSKIRSVFAAARRYVAY